MSDLLLALKLMLTFRTLHHTMNLQMKTGASAGHVNTENCHLNGKTEHACPNTTLLGTVIDNNINTEVMNIKHSNDDINTAI